MSKQPLSKNLILQPIIFDLYFFDWIGFCLDYIGEIFIEIFLNLDLHLYS